MGLRSYQPRRGEVCGCAGGIDDLACETEQIKNMMAGLRRSHAVPMRAIPVASALLALLAIAVLARPVWDALVELFAEPWPDRGAAVLLFTNEQPEEIWMVSLQVDGSEHMHEWPPDRRGWVVRRPAGPPRPAEFGPKIVSAIAGHTGPPSSTRSAAIRRG